MNIIKQKKERCLYDIFTVLVSIIFTIFNVFVFAPIPAYVFETKKEKVNLFKFMYEIAPWILIGTYCLIIVIFMYQMIRLWFLMRKNLFFLNNLYKAINPFKIFMFYMLAISYLIS